MSRIIRIGTRDSELALWQANKVKIKLETLGHKTELVAVKSTGDLVLDKPLYEMGITGIFTKTLDVAMLNGAVDIAVHSMKDVPTALPEGIIQTAVLERAETEDVLVTKGDIDYTKRCTIATGSLRRKAQWLHRYPHHTVVSLRGNVNTRLQKLKDNNWDGAIFAKAGLKRINILPENYIDLHWMTPAPAQGAMVIVTLQNDDYSTKAVSKLNHKPSEICAQIERDFLRKLEGGCTAPIGALAEIKENNIEFKGCLFSLDGKQKIEISDSMKYILTDEQKHSKQLKFKYHLGIEKAEELLENGGSDLMKEIKAEMNP